jgi:hypothetical protein
MPVAATDKAPRIASRGNAQLGHTERRHFMAELRLYRAPSWVCAARTKSRPSPGKCAAWALRAHCSITLGAGMEFSASLVATTHGPVSLGEGAPD